MNALPIPADDTAFELDLRHISDACCDDGALVYEHELPALIEELENRNGEPPDEEQVIRHAVAEYARRCDAAID